MCNLFFKTKANELTLESEMVTVLSISDNYFALKMERPKARNLLIFAKLVVGV